MIFKYLSVIPICLVMGLLTLSCKTTQGSGVFVTKAGPAFAYEISDKRAMIKVAEVIGLKTTIQNLKGNLNKNPKNLKILTALAENLLVSGDLNGAEKIARRALDIDFRNNENKMVLAQIAYLRGHVKLSEGIIQGVFSEKSAESSESLNLLGCIRLAKNDVNGAMDLFARAIENNPDNVAAMTNLGILHLHRQNPDEAQVQFKNALKKLPENPDLLMHLGITYAVLGQYEKATEQYDKVSATYRNSPILIFNMAILKKRQGQFAEALAGLKKYVKLTQGQQISGEVIVGLIADLKRQQAAQETSISDGEIDELVAQTVSR